MSMDFEATCKKCGRVVKIELEMGIDLINVKVMPCWGCARGLVQDIMSGVKESLDKETKEEPCQK